MKYILFAVGAILIVGAGIGIGVAVAANDRDGSSVMVADGDDIGTMPAPTSTPTPAPTSTPIVRVDSTMSISGFECSEYGTEEEAAMNSAIAASLSDVDTTDIGDHTCTDTDDRRRLAPSDRGARRGLGATDVVELGFSITMSVDPSSTLTSSDQISAISTALTASVSSGDFANNLETAAANAGLTTLDAVVVNSISIATEAPTTAPPSGTPTPAPSSSGTTAPTMTPTSSCRSTCYGGSCDSWMGQDDETSCIELESYGCSCSGCASCDDTAFIPWYVPDVEVLAAAPERVIVIGAGVSGLAAAYALQANGIDVVVLEAKDRVGGRIWGADVGAARVDLGASYIHGTMGSASADVIEALGIGWTRDQSADGVVFDEGGTDFDYSDWETYESSFYNALDRGRVQGPSVGDAIDDWVELRSYSGDDERLARWVVSMPQEVQGGADMKYVDLAAAMEYEEDLPTGGDAMPVGTYRTLVEWLAEPLDIRLSEPVTNISWDADGVTVTSENGTYNGSHVLVTVPLGVLKAGGIDFAGGLPQDKLDVIEEIGFGKVEKVVLTYDEVWWNGGEGGGAVFIDAESEGVFPFWIDLTAQAGAPTLCCIYGGDFVGTVKNWTDEEILSGARAVVNTVLGQDPEPNATALTRWATDPFFRGSYGFDTINSTLALLTTMSEPVDGRVLFAGEATLGEDGPNWSASVHGAFLSGLREARRLGVGNFSIPGTENH